MTKTYRLHGISGFYSGLAPQLFADCPKKAIRLTTNDACRKMFSDENGNISFLGKLGSGAIAGASDVFIGSPFELAKVRMQLDSGVYISLTVLICTLFFGKHNNNFSLFWSENLPLPTNYWELDQNQKKNFTKFFLRPILARNHCITVNLKLSRDS